MLWNASLLDGYAISASDGELGTVSDFLFDETSWLVRWLATHPSRCRAANPIHPQYCAEQPKAGERSLFRTWFRRTPEASAYPVAPLSNFRGWHPDRTGC